MIFVTIGTCEPFDRLLAAVDRLELTEELVVQVGTSTVRPRNARCVDFLDYDELVQLVRTARLVITHAGVGTILTVLGEGKQPIVVPRRQQDGDAVDDHQLELAERLATLGLVCNVSDPDDLATAVEATSAATAQVRRGGALASDLGRYIAGVAG